MKWPTIRLGDVCRVVPGFAFKSQDWTTAGIPVVKIKNIREDNTVDLSATDHVPADILTPRLSKFVLKNNDILLAMTGATAGKVGRVRTNRPVLLNQRVAKIAPEKADPRFIWSIVSSQRYQELFFRLADGAAQPNMSGGQIEGLEIPNPPIEVQRRVGAILSAYDDLIENNTRRIAILEEMARRIYEEWFVRFRFPGHDGERMVESELGLVPEGWEVAELGQLAEVNARSVRRGAEPTEIRYVDISSVSTGSIDNKESMLFADAPGRARRIVRDGDVIWACVRPNRKSYSLVVDPEPNLLVSTGFAVLSPIAAPSSFIYQCVTTDDFVSHLVNHAEGAAYPAVGAEDFATAKVLKPANDLVKAFDRIAGPMMRLVATLQVKNANLRTTRDLLLPKLISGELDVSSLPEPESLAA